MLNSNKSFKFKAQLLRPAIAGEDASWSFVILPKAVSDSLPRRGRTTACVTINGHSFQSTLEPDGQLSHWVKIREEQCLAAGANIGDVATVEVSPLAQEPEPELPADFREALALNSKARAVWDDTSAVAKVDWIHWMVTAKQAKTREKRINNACDMLASGKKRVCCFDPSGFYSKALSAPKVAK